MPDRDTACRLFAATEPLEGRRLFAVTVYAFFDANQDGKPSLGESQAFGNGQPVVYVDADGDGVIDLNEPKATPQTLGGYGFQGLAPGTYPVRSEYTRPFAGASRKTVGPVVSMTVGVDGNGPRVNVPVPVDTGIIVGRTFADLDSDAVWDRGEPADPAFYNKAFVDLNDDGVAQSSEPVSYEYTSDTWQIGGLPAGTYVVRLLDTAAREPSPGTSFRQVVTVAERAITRGVFFAYNTFNTAAATVKAFAFDDRDENGRADEYETGITYGYVYDDVDNDALMDDGETRAAFVSSGFDLVLSPGPHTLRYTAGGLRPTTPARQVNVVAGQRIVGVSFGVTDAPAAPTAVLGRVFVDLDGDGVRDGNETSAAAGSVRLDLNNDGVFASTEPLAAIGHDGTFLFDNLTPRAYAVQASFSDSYKQIALVGPARPVVVTAGTISDVDVAMPPFPGPATRIAGVVQDSVLTTLDRITAPPVVGAIVWIDVDRDGTRGADEPVRVTDAAGAFAFDDVPLGEYELRLERPAGYDPNSNQSFSRTTTGLSERSPWQRQLQFRVASGTASISGTTFNDSDGDGLRDPDETLGVGKTVFLDLDNDGLLDTNEARVVTGADGAWAFTGLAAGSYRVRRVFPAGYAQSTPVRDVTVVRGQVVADLTIGSRSAPAWLSAAAGAVYTLSGNALAVLSGVVTLNGTASATNPDLSVEVSGSAGVVFGATQRLAALRLNDTATAAVAAGGNRVLRVTGLTIATNATLDLNDNALVLDYDGTTPQAAGVAARIATARSGGAWTGSGLTSSTARNTASGRTTLGYLEAADFHQMRGAAATFIGETVDDTAVLVRYTLSGDLDLDSGVSVNDFNRLSSSFGMSASSWANGDLDYDNGTSINDFNLMSANFGQALPPATSQSRTIAKAK